MDIEVKDKANRRHVGHNLQKIRVYFGMKQEALAADLGVNQQVLQSAAKTALRGPLTGLYSAITILEFGCRRPVAATFKCSATGLSAMILRYRWTCATSRRFSKVLETVL